MKVVFKDGARVKNKYPDTVFKALNSIRATHGKLEPRTVWQEARSEDHPLHIEFEWDDTVAAARHRDEQARLLMRSIEVIEEVNGEEMRSRAFIAVEEDSSVSYDPLDLVLSSEEKYAYALKDARGYLLAAQKRLQGLRSAKDIAPLIVKAIKLLERKLSRRKTA